MKEKLKQILCSFFTRRFIRFVLVAMMNTAFGILINWLLLFIVQDILHLNKAYIVSNLLATVISILFNFKTYSSLVFKNKDNRLIFRFLFVTTLTYFCNIGGIALLEHTLCANNYVNLAVMAIPIGLLNYTLYSFLVFKKTRS